jgi:CRISPR-associated protein Csx17
VPVPSLSAAWAVQADDGSSEFRIATALAGLSFEGQDGTGKPTPVGLRPHLTPVALDLRNWMPESRWVCWGQGSLERNLLALLHRRRLEAATAGAEDHALASPVGVPLSDVLRFLDDQTDDARIASLAAGLACVGRLPHPSAPVAGRPLAPPPAYALLKPLFCPDELLRELNWLPTDRHMTLPGELPARLASGDVAAALALAWHRLRALDKPLPGRTAPRSTGISGLRLLAALLIPLSLGGMKSVLESLAFGSADATDADTPSNITDTLTTA